MKTNEEQYAELITKIKTEAEQILAKVVGVKDSLNERYKLNEGDKPISEKTHPELFKKMHKRDELNPIIHNFKTAIDWLKSPKSTMAPQAFDLIKKAVHDLSSHSVDRGMFHERVKTFFKDHTKGKNAPRLNDVATEVKNKSDLEKNMVSAMQLKPEMFVKPAAKTTPSKL